MCSACSAWVSCLPACQRGQVSFPSRLGSSALRIAPRPVSGGIVTTTVVYEVRPALLLAPLAGLLVTLWPQLCRVLVARSGSLLLARGGAAVQQQLLECGGLRGLSGWLTTAAFAICTFLGSVLQSRHPSAGSAGAARLEGLPRSAQPASRRPSSAGGGR